MKKWVIFLVFVLVFANISYAKVIDVPEVSTSDEVELDIPEDDLREESPIGVTRYTYAGGNLVASSNSEGVKYYHKDRLSNRLTTDSSGEVSGRFLSLPFGQKIVDEVKYGFTGKEEDSSGLYYFGARYYGDSLGRFTSVDSYTGVGGNLPYAYVANNPMNMVDPSGNKIKLSSDFTQEQQDLFWDMYSIIMDHSECHRNIYEREDIVVEVNPSGGVNTANPTEISVFWSGEGGEEGLSGLIHEFLHIDQFLGQKEKYGIVYSDQYRADIVENTDATRTSNQLIRNMGEWDATRRTIDIATKMRESLQDISVFERTRMFWGITLLPGRSLGNIISQQENYGKDYLQYSRHSMPDEFFGFTDEKIMEEVQRTFDLGAFPEENREEYISIFFVELKSQSQK